MITVFRTCAHCYYAKPEAACVRVGQYWFCLLCFESGRFWQALLHGADCDCHTQ